MKTHAALLALFANQLFSGNTVTSAAAAQEVCQCCSLQGSKCLYSLLPLYSSRGRLLLSALLPCSFDFLSASLTARKATTSSTKALGNLEGTDYLSNLEAVHHGRRQRRQPR